MATDHDTNRWRGITAAAFVATAFGVGFGRPAVLLLGAVGVGYSAYSKATAPPVPDLAVERTLSDDTPRLDDDVEVTVAVTNEGSTTLPDVRLVDGVPDALEVVEGSPRFATALRPGATATFAYTVRADRGHHEFEPATVIARDWSGANEHEDAVEAPTSFTCTPELEPLPSFPLRTQAARFAGSVTTNTGGAGLEFHSTREYRRGDPLARIDWKRRARTGRLATVEFREERGATVALVVDAREEAYVADAEGVSAVEHEIRAARHSASALLDGGNPVGVAAFGPELSWHDPSLGRVHRAELRDFLALDDGLGPRPPEGEFVSRDGVRQLLQRLPSDAQILFFSPVTDNTVPVIVRRFEAYGHPVTVVSPDVTDGESAGASVASLERADRLREIRESGIRVVDWDPDSPFQVAVQNAREGWSR